MRKTYERRKKYYIRLYNAVNSEDYYNMVEDANPPRNNYTYGDAVRGRKQIHLAEESKFVKLSDLENFITEGWELGPPRRQKESQSKRSKERLVNPENHPMYGRHQSKESIAMMVANHVYHSGEEHHMYGKHFTHTDEAKKKIGVSSSNRKYPNRTYHLTCKNCRKEFLGNASNIKLCDGCKNKGVIIS